MKKSAWAWVVVLTILILGSGVSYLALRPKEFSAAAFLPDSALVLVEFLDIEQSKKRWDHTALASILREPQMQRFLAPGTRHMQEDASFKEAFGFVSKMKIRKIFFAIPNLEEIEHVPMLVGFRFDGSRRDVEDAFRRMREEVVGPAGAIEVEQYQEVELTTARSDSRSIVTAILPGLGLVGTDVGVLKDFIDRKAGRASGASLAEAKLYLGLKPRLQEDADGMLYVRPRPIVDALAVFGESLGARVDPVQLNALQQIQGVGYSIVLGQKNIEDRFVVDSASASVVAPLSRDILAFIPKTSVLFFQKAFAPGSSFLKGVYSHLPENAQETLAKQGIYPETFDAAFGNQAGAFVNWAPGVNFPEVAIIVETESVESVENLVTHIGSVTGSDMEVVTTNAGKLFSWNSPALLFMRPMVLVTQEVVVIGILPGSVDGALNAFWNGTSLQKEDGKSDILSYYNQNNIQFAYCDSAKIVTNLYRLGLPFLSLVAAMLPTINNWIDPGNVPDVSAITSHLQPIKYSLHREQNYLIGNSDGPITFSQFGLLFLLSGYLANPQQ